MPTITIGYGTGGPGYTDAAHPAQRGIDGAPADVGGKANPDIISLGTLTLTGWQPSDGSSGSPGNPGQGGGGGGGGKTLEGAALGGASGGCGGCGGGGGLGGGGGGSSIAIASFESSISIDSCNLSTGIGGQGGQGAGGAGGLSVGILYSGTKPVYDKSSTIIALEDAGLGGDIGQGGDCQLDDLDNPCAHGDPGNPGPNGVSGDIYPPDSP